MRLFLNDINVSFGDNEILKNITFEVNDKEKIAIVGRNGCGKTTLLKVITGEQEIDLGFQGTLSDKIQKTGKFRIGFLRQIAFEDNSETFENEILKAYKEVIDLKNRIADVEKELESGGGSNIFKYEEMLANFDLMGGYTYLKEYNLAIKKFGFTDEDKNKKLSEFSGGQRTKIALIKLLLSKPDLLILDEPTNHLDITSIRWLEEYLAGYPKAIIIVSHDRAFLDKFVNVVYEIERNKIKRYPGNYTHFATAKKLNYEKDLKEYNEKVQEKNRLQAVADRFRYKATKASMAQSKLKMIEKMGDIEKPESADDRVFSTSIKPRIESGDDVLLAENIEIGYTTPLAKLTFKIMKGDRIGVVGGNGLGKSTLLKTLVGKIPLLKGKIKFGTNVDIGYFDQQVVDNNPIDESILDNYIRHFPEDDFEKARRILGGFNFTQDDVYKSLKKLSGGEKVRLELCKILRKAPNFLILDEPTNHMDIMGKEALEKMLENYEGTIICVSHDRYFINKIANHLIVFEDGQGEFLKNTTYAEYENKLKNNISQPNDINVKKKDNVKKESEASTNEYFLNKEKNKRQAKRKKLEEKISVLESEIKEISLNLEKPEVYSDYIKIAEYQKEIDLRSAEIDKLMEEWLSLDY